MTSDQLQELLLGACRDQQPDQTEILYSDLQGFNIFNRDLQGIQKALMGIIGMDWDCMEVWVKLVPFRDGQKLDNLENKYEHTTKIKMNMGHIGHILRIVKFLQYILSVQKEDTIPYLPGWWLEPL